MYPTKRSFLNPRAQPVIEWRISGYVTATSYCFKEVKILGSKFFVKLVHKKYLTILHFVTCYLGLYIAYIDRRLFRKWRWVRPGTSVFFYFFLSHRLCSISFLPHVICKTRLGPRLRLLDVWSMVINKLATIHRQSPQQNRLHSSAPALVMEKAIVCPGIVTGECITGNRIR